MKILEKIFSYLPVPEKQTESLYLINGERGALQFVVEADEDVESRIKVNSDIQTKFFRVDEIPENISAPIQKPLYKWIEQNR